MLFPCWFFKPLTDDGQVIAVSVHAQSMAIAASPEAPNNERTDANCPHVAEGRRAYCVHRAAASGRLAGFLAARAGLRLN